VDGAIREFNKAIRLKPDVAQTYYNLGTTLRTKGDLDGAIAAFREAIRLQPGDGLTHNNLALALFDKGDLDGEIASYRDAIRVEPDLALAYSNLGTALRNEGDLDGAITAFREAVRLEPDNADARDDLNAALLDKGDLDPALSGSAPPRDALERIDFAENLYSQARHAESARMYAEAFAEDAALAEDLAEGHRYNAACSASLEAARGESDAAEWRGRALEWLNADLAAREKAPSGLLATLERWKRDPDLAGVRDRLDELPMPERDACRSLWAAVDRTSAAARPEAK
jgi:tetratricopeptide (TPR) repeat protein